MTFYIYYNSNLGLPAAARERRPLERQCCPEEEVHTRLFHPSLLTKILTPFLLFARMVSSGAEMPGRAPVRRFERCLLAAPIGVERRTGWQRGPGRRPRGGGVSRSISRCLAVYLAQSAVRDAGRSPSRSWPSYASEAIRIHTSSRSRSHIEALTCERGHRARHPPRRPRRSWRRRSA